MGLRCFPGSALASIDASGAVSYGDYPQSGIKSMRKAIVRTLSATFGDGELMSNSLLKPFEAGRDAAGSANIVCGFIEGVKD